MRGFWHCFAILFVVFSPASCSQEKGGDNIATAIVKYLEKAK